MENRTDLLKAHLDEVVNKSWNYADRCVTPRDHWNNATLGLTGEAGEVADEVKKFLYHTPKDWEIVKGKLRYELGDVLFYWLKILDLAGLSVEEVVAGNREKLESRHPELGKVTERFGEGAIR